MIYINHLKPGGAENQVLRLVENQNHKVNKTYIVTRSRYSDDLFLKKFDDCRVKIIFIDENHNRKLAQIIFLRWFLKKYEIEIVQSYLSGDNIFCSLITIGKSAKHISGYRGDYGNPVFKRTVFQKLKDYFSWFLSDVIVSNNECGIKYLTGLPLISKEKVVFIPNGIELGKDYSQTKYLNVIGCLSNFWQYKNHNTLIEAYVKIKKRYQLKLAGDGPEFDKCYEFLEKHNCIPEEILIGSIYDVDDFFKRIGIFIYPSLREGSPNSLLEAMSYGKFCLVSDIPEHREALGPEVHINCFFEPKSSDDLIKKILFWDQNKTEMLVQAKNNRIRIMKEYSIKILSNSFNRLYDSF